MRCSVKVQAKAGTAARNAQRVALPAPFVGSRRTNALDKEIAALPALQVSPGGLQLSETHYHCLPAAHSPQVAASACNTASQLNVPACDPSAAAPRLRWQAWRQRPRRSPARDCHVRRCGPKEDFDAG